MLHDTEAAAMSGKGAANLALRRRFAALCPDLELSASGYVAALEDNLLPGVEPRQFVEDLARGSGRELDAKFRAVHSSAALVVNSFARFKDQPAQLTLAGLTGFRTLTFERVCPTDLRAPGQPNLDLGAEGPAGVIAVESKCTEPLSPTMPRFSPAYEEQIRDERRGGEWFHAMRTVQSQPDSFRLLDVAQLIKHAFGLARCFKEQPTTLLYLYWEPMDAACQAIMLAHRREIESFARLIAGGCPTFLAQSYLDLWDEWQEAGRPTWLKDHVSNLRARYAVSLGDRPQI